MVLECRSAETGVGPSMAEGNHGWRPNWADFAVAASSSPARGRVLELSMRKICWNSIEQVFRQYQVIARIKPMSPIRL